ncbi:hypothetical protein GGR88_002704 [Sphingomonas jejuensis]|uniref:DUF2059 domain-containing protein n=1 Tax=Sphingomonas jejuensis TaxID=904715 RepID=A0ABX0XPM8_9SPHN|nr:DUF2059 domain-containing protein [Sphingomonas jejuensis]NJC35190.1 hypothetical protein [Sphingomonas jejuensis]
MMLLLILLAATQPAAPPPPVASRAETARPVSAEALALAELLAGPDLVFGPGSQQQARAMMIDLYGRDPGMQEIEARSPGTAAAVVDAILPIVTRSAERRLPGLHQRLGALYQQRFTPGEIGRLRAFYGSPTGIRFIRGMQQRVNGDATVESAAARRDRVPDSSAVLEDLGRAGQATAMALSPADQEVLMRLRDGGLLQKVERMNPEAARTLVAWSQELSAEDQTEIMTASQEIVRKRLAGAEKQR